MTLFQAVVCGVVQGLAEFLPVSSSGHLILLRSLLGWEDPGLYFDVALHFGTLLAVIAYFFKDWLDLVRSVLDKTRPQAHRRLFWLLVAATVPGALAGKLLEKWAEETFRAPTIVAVMLIVVGLLMWWGDSSGKLGRQLESLELPDALKVGCAQAFAVIPGVSRSGSTITAALFLGLTRDAAARLSFLMSTPIIAGACTLGALHLRHEGIPADQRAAFAAGILTSAVVGYAAVSGFIRYLRTNTLKPFVIYRIAAGLLVLALSH
ncbi:MAG: undecaprenyl-diphosphatase UppP [Elusimicrobia bacterium]|nr:undecaprenyl-diphosphatase UppP [Elusimicrobiota bacterium]